MNIKTKFLNLIFDVLLIILAFLNISFLKDEIFFSVLEKYDSYVVGLIFVFIVISLLFDKYEKKSLLKHKEISKRFFLSWIFASLICLSLIYVIRIDFVSRFVMLGILLLILVFEFIWLTTYFVFRYAIRYEDNIQDEHYRMLENSKNGKMKITEIEDDEIVTENLELIDLMQTLFGSVVIEKLREFVRFDSKKTEFVETTNVFSILSKQSGIKSLVNFSRINDARRINKLFEATNIKLQTGGRFICCAETNGVRKTKFQTKFSYFWSMLYFFDFLVRRIWPKIPYVNRLYFAITKGRNRALSHAEVLGRLYSCGFAYVDSFIYNNLTWYIVEKKQEPKVLDSPTYGPFIKLRRIGKNGKVFNVYKLRTMHPYSEFLQQYVFEHNSLDETGKFKDDFRISTLGRLFRKVWLDELPMVWNVLKGDMKIVGVRPLSQHYFNLYPEEVKQMRIKHKPGLVPPFYVDMPKGFGEVVESERKYLMCYQKSPKFTDFKYFFKAFYNIFFKGARSK